MTSRRGGNVFLTAGLPLMVFIVGSTYMLSQLVSGQVHVKDRRGSRSIREFQLEEEHRHMMKEFEDDYEIRRIPRPDERQPPYESDST